MLRDSFYKVCANSFAIIEQMMHRRTREDDADDKEGFVQ